ncbi:MAG: hypothetical protein R2854_29530 [Caldilineaceae bacterium]
MTGHSSASARSLALRYAGRRARAQRPCGHAHRFVPSRRSASTSSKRGYALLASPSSTPARPWRPRSAPAANATPVECCLYVRVYGEGDVLTVVRRVAADAARTRWDGGAHLDDPGHRRCAHRRRGRRVGQ